MKRLLLFLTAILILQHANAQEVINVMASQSGEKAIIKYDIANSSPSTNYFVKLYYSTDGGSSFSQELRYVTGDVGANVAGGTGKTITWNTMKEVNALIGNVVFKVEANSISRMPELVSIDDYTFKVTSCTRLGDGVRVNFEMTNNGNDKLQNFSNASNNSRFVDNFGRIYRISKGEISGVSIFKRKLYTSKEVYSGYVIADNINKEANKLSKITLKGYIPSRDISITIKNIPIQ